MYWSSSRWKVRVPFRLDSVGYELFTPKSKYQDSSSQTIHLVEPWWRVFVAYQKQMLEGDLRSGDPACMNQSKALIACCLQACLANEWQYTATFKYKHIVLCLVCPVPSLRKEHSSASERCVIFFWVSILLYNISARSFFHAIVFSRVFYARVVRRVIFDTLLSTREFLVRLVALD